MVRGPAKILAWELKIKHNFQWQKEIQRQFAIYLLYQGHVEDLFADGILILILMHVYLSLMVAVGETKIGLFVRKTA